MVRRANPRRSQRNDRLPVSMGIHHPAAHTLVPALGDRGAWLAEMLIVTSPPPARGEGRGGRGRSTSVAADVIGVPVEMGRQQPMHLTG